MPSSDDDYETASDSSYDGSESEEEEISDLSSELVVTKYRLASDITNKALKEVLAGVKAGAKVVDLCKIGDKVIEESVSTLYKKDKDVYKGVAFPTCVSVNNVCGNYSPLESEDTVVLADGDVVKVTLGTHVDGFIAEAGVTVVCGGGAIEGRKADVITAVTKAAEAAHRLLRPGNKGSQVTDAIAKIAAAYKVNAVEGVLSHDLKRFVIDGNKVIIGKSTPEFKVEECEFEENEVYSIDIMMSTGEGKAPAERDTRATVYKRNADLQYRVKMKASQQIFAEINKRFITMPFTLRAISDERVAKLGITECRKHDLVLPYPVLYEADGAFVAQVKFTALVMPSVTHRLSLQPELQLKSEHSIQDAEIVALLSKSTKKARNKKKADAPAAASSAPAAK